MSEFWKSSQLASWSVVSQKFAFREFWQANGMTCLFVSVPRPVQILSLSRSLSLSLSLSRATVCSLNIEQLEMIVND